MPTLVIPHIELAGSFDESLNPISIIVGLLSIIGSLFNITITIYLQKSKTIIGKMVIILAVYDILNILPLVLTSIDLTTTQFTCEIAGSWISYFGFASSFFFTTCFAHALHQTLKKNSIESIRKYFKGYIALSILTGLIVGSFAVALRLKEYEVFPDGNKMCQTHFPSGFHLTILLVYIIPGIVNIIGCLVYYILIIRILKEMSEKLHLGLLIYPVILVVCVSPAVIRRFFYLIGKDINSPFYIQASIAMFRAQGFLNALTYGLSREILDALKKHCCSGRNRSDSSSSLIEESETQLERYKAYTL